MVNGEVVHQPAGQMMHHHRLQRGDEPVAAPDQFPGLLFAVIALIQIRGRQQVQDAGQKLQGGHLLHHQELRGNVLQQIGHLNDVQKVPYKEAKASNNRVRILPCRLSAEAVNRIACRAAATSAAHFERRTR